MRRNDKQISDKSQIEAIIRESLVCRLALTDGAQPYIVPLCFGYEDNTLFFHSAPEGKKIDIIKTNDHVCFEFDTGNETIEAENPCEWGMKYRSVIGFGKATVLDDVEEKRRALGVIMKQYSERPHSFPDDIVKHVAVIKIAIRDMTGKQSEY